MFSRVQLTAFAVFACLAPALALLATPLPEQASLAALGVLAVAVFAMVALHGAAVAPAVVPRGGPPPSAQRRRRGSYLRQSNPDTAGRPRPRAPGLVTG
ncbi:DUF6412 domain-containing protein [Nocardia lijiangensis]|uniref:DUF6412 domain-containing protein n=1 Tax=Nocardia lijiangensis TaxID=299618 RepID=UPI00082C29EC|nr:DUF6412 domain-containing protein [Nocardia lijiangensis]